MQTDWVAPFLATQIIVIGATLIRMYFGIKEGAQSQARLEARVDRMDKEASELELWVRERFHTQGGEIGKMNLSQAVAHGENQAALARIEGVLNSLKENGKH